MQQRPETRDILNYNSFSVTHFSFRISGLKFIIWRLRLPVTLQCKSTILLLCHKGKGKQTFSTALQFGIDLVAQGEDAILPKAKVVWGVGKKAVFITAVLKSLTL